MSAWIARGDHSHISCPCAKRRRKSAESQDESEKKEEQLSWNRSAPGQSWHNSSWGTSTGSFEQATDKTTSVRFIVSLAPGSEAAAYSDLALGPARLRIVGTGEDLGAWDPHMGVDLFWEGNRWTSSIVDVPADSFLKFRIAHVEDAPDLLDIHPIQARNMRRFVFGRQFFFQSLQPGQVLEVALTTGCKSQLESFHTLERSACLVQTQQDLAGRLAEHKEGTQRIYTFGGSSCTLDFSLYLPPGFSQASTPWPVLIFLHAMHGRLDSDINLFFESEAPPQLLLEGQRQCPSALRDRFVVITPQCPRDRSHGGGSGVWFYTNWYHGETYLPGIEGDMAALVKMVTQLPHVHPDFVAMTGTSMGGMGCLEFASRRPGLIKACVPVAAHYEFDVDALVDRLTETQSIPFWFIHAYEDTLCPIEQIDTIVEKLKARSQAEVRYTAYHDTWSNTGHCADRVAYHRHPRSDEQLALGEEVFSWILEQMPS